MELSKTEVPGNTLGTDQHHGDSERVPVVPLPASQNWSHSLGHGLCLVLFLLVREALRGRGRPRPEHWQGLCQSQPALLLAWDAHKTSRSPRQQSLWALSVKAIIVQADFPRTRKPSACQPHWPYGCWASSYQCWVYWLKLVPSSQNVSLLCAVLMRCEQIPRAEWNMYCGIK